MVAESNKFVVKPVMLGQLKKDRFNLVLGGPSHSGKSTGAASFFGGDRGKCIWVMIEHGQPEGAGGATPLLYLKGINDRLDPDRDVMVLRVTSWEEMQATHKWICENAVRLVKEGYVGLVLDGITELSNMVEDSFTEIDVAALKGSEYTEGQAKRDAKLYIVTDIDGLPGSSMEQNDYGSIIRRIRSFVKKVKLLPFTLIITAGDGPLYDKETKLQKGIGPDLTGKKLPDMFTYQVDYYFHCERRIVKAVPAMGGKPAQPQRIEYVWLTANDPSIVGNQNRFFAKTRAGMTLDQYEPADGARLLQKLGIDPAREAARAVEEAKQAFAAKSGK